MIPWLYVNLSTPATYKANLKTLKENPDLAPLLHKWAGLKTLRLIVGLPLVIVLLPLIILMFTGAAIMTFVEWVSDRIPKPLQPLHDKIGATMTEIRQKLKSKNKFVALSGR